MEISENGAPNFDTVKQLLTGHSFGGIQWANGLLHFFGDQTGFWNVYQLCPTKGKLYPLNSLQPTQIQNQPLATCIRSKRRLDRLYGILETIVHTLLPMKTVWFSMWIIIFS
jgi:hypothetical protein